MGTNILQ